MSLRWRILRSLVYVIVPTVLISVGVGYYTTQSRLGVFVDEIRNDEASQLAQNLSREYTTTGGWETVDRPLSEAGYVYEKERHGEGSEESERESFQPFHIDPIRVVIADVDRRVVKDNFAVLPAGATAPNLDGYRETVFDLTTNLPVGYVYVDITMTSYRRSHMDSSTRFCLLASSAVR